MNDPVPACGNWKSSMPLVNAGDTLRWTGADPPTSHSSIAAKSAPVDEPVTSICKRRSVRAMSSVVALKRSTLSVTPVEPAATHFSTGADASAATLYPPEVLMVIVAPALVASDSLTAEPSSFVVTAQSGEPAEKSNSIVPPVVAELEMLPIKFNVFELCFETTRLLSSVRVIVCFEFPVTLYTLEPVFSCVIPSISFSPVILAACAVLVKRTCALVTRRSSPDAPASSVKRPSSIPVAGAITFCEESEADGVTVSDPALTVIVDPVTDTAGVGVIALPVD